MRFTAGNRDQPMLAEVIPLTPDFRLFKGEWFANSQIIAFSVCAIIVHIACVVRLSKWRKIIGKRAKMVEHFTAPTVASVYIAGAMVLQFSGPTDRLAYLAISTFNTMMFSLLSLRGGIFRQRGPKRKKRVTNLGPRDVNSEKRYVGNHAYNVKVVITSLSITTLLLRAAGAFQIQISFGWMLQVTVAGVTGATIYFLVTKRFATRFLFARSPLSFGDARDELERLQPQFAFHLAGSGNRTFHATMWIPYLKALNVPFFLVVRERHHMLALEKVIDVPIIYAPSVSKLSQLHFSSLRCVFYANNGMKNIHMLRLMSAKHIQLLHGDSDKPASYHPANKMFTYVFVAGEMAIERYRKHGVKIDLDIFRIVGRPQISGIVEPNSSVERNSLRIAYLTTWSGDSADTKFSTVDIAPQLIEELRAFSGPQSHIIFKPHPLSLEDRGAAPLIKKIRESLKTTGASRGTGIFVTDRPLHDIYNDVDILVSDVSSVANDFLFSGKPIIIVTPEMMSIVDFRDNFPSLSGAYILEPNRSNLQEILLDIVSGDSMKGERLLVRAKVFGDIGRPPGELFHQTCMKILDED